MDLERVFVAVGRAEGLSLLALFGIAMPLKYGLGEPGAVEWVGLIHGVLFLVYVGALFVMARAQGWGLSRVALGLVGSVLPFGTFLFERTFLSSPR